MSTANIQFSCPGCQKKFSTPSSLAGKVVTCSCGTKVPVPSPQSPGAAAPAAAMQQPTAYPSAVGQQVLSTSPSFTPTTPPQGGFGPSSGRARNRRDFPALKYVAKCIDVISWLYIVAGMMAAVGVVVAAGPDSFPISLLGGVVVALIVLLVAVFIRASAELIRLGLYIAELLEDIREK